MKMCVIAARAGSKGLPDKNIKPFAGKPLLAHSIDQAKASGLFDIIAVSSDSQIYLEIGRDAGANLLIRRPSELATDFAGKPPVLRHALFEGEREFDGKIEVLVDLQPTSPLRAPSDIAGAVDRLLANPDLNNVVSVGPAKASPYYTLVEGLEDGRIQLSKAEAKFVRRQDLPDCYQLNGSIYAWRRRPIIDAMPALNDKTSFWLMDEACNVDIDTPLDFAIAAFVAHHHFGWPVTDL